jgi:hypothetical protein
MSSRRLAALVFAADLVAVVVFAAIGRSSHDESGDLLGLAGTAAPFAVGLVAAWALPTVRANPPALRSGLVVWAGAAVLGLALRAAFTGRLPLSFAVVTVIALGVLLVGWRGLTAAVRVGRRRALLR